LPGKDRKHCLSPEIVTLPVVCKWLVLWSKYLYFSVLLQKLATRCKLLETTHARYKACARGYVVILVASLTKKGLWGFWDFQRFKDFKYFNISTTFWILKKILWDFLVKFFYLLKKFRIFWRWFENALAFELF